MWTWLGEKSGIIIVFIDKRVNGPNHIGLDINKKNTLNPHIKKV